ncbi:MAG: hypothetical protein LQ338_002132 [Usnochroma carphineum]|nr:MAG: hypothetical protein LQ338_002132 [Usnochroma carphineum]
MRSRSSAERALDIEASANQAHAEASRRRRLESGRATLRDALSYEHPHHSMDMRRDHSYALNMMRPPLPSTTSSSNPSRRPRHRSVIWESGLEVSSSGLRAGGLRTPPPAYIPSPPYTSGDRSDRSSPDTLPSAHPRASLTPRFAPAYPLPDINSVTGLAQLRRGEPHHMDETTDDPMTNELPPLRRVSRRYPPRPHRLTSRVLARHHAIDGLGDRWRSVSPDEDSWDTLLSTMPPDDRLPSSASTSFRSNEDLAYYESLASLSAESMRGAMDLYPTNCENTDTEFSEADEILPELVEGPPRTPTRQLPPLPDREPVEVINRDQRRPNRGRL